MQNLEGLFQELRRLRSVMQNLHHQEAALQQDTAPLLCDIICPKLNSGALAFAADFDYCGMAPDDFNRLSRQLASEASLRSGWSQVAQDLYTLVSSVVDVPEELIEPMTKEESPPTVGGVRLLRRTMQMMEECGSPITGNLMHSVVLDFEMLLCRFNTF